MFTLKKKCSTQCFCDGSCKEGYVKSNTNYQAINNQKPLRISSFTNVLHITETENILNFRTEDFSVSKDGFEKFHSEEHFTDVVYNGKILNEEERKELFNRLFSPQKTMKQQDTMIDLIIKVIEATEKIPNDLELGRKIRKIICESK